MLSSREPVIIRLAGSQAEMGRQHAKHLLELGGWQDAFDFYPRMPALLLNSGLPRHLKGAWFEKLFRLLSKLPLERMENARPAAFRARTHAFVDGLGLPAHRARDFMVMDVFQNAVNLLGRFGMLEKTNIASSAVGCCSTLMVWDDASDDGSLKHARNFDFPGVGIWDTAPAIVFCAPDEGLRYGFVTTRGADTPGVTSFNEAGLTITLHTRFHRDIALRGTPVVDVAHDIIRRAETIQDAIDISREYRLASSWGMFVSAANERRGVSLEATACGIEVVEAGDASHLAGANRYRTPSLQRGELTTSAAFAVHSDCREARLDTAARRASQAQGLSVEDLQSLLGDEVDPQHPDAMRSGAGNTVSQPITVKSIVNEPEASCIHVAVGPAPTAQGPWIRIPYRWDSEPVEHLADSTPLTPVDVDHKTAQGLYVEATRLHIVDGAEAKVRRLLERAVELQPEEPHYRFLAAIFALMDRDAEVALAHLDAALALPQSEFRTGQTLLWAARAADVMGDSDRATSLRHALFSLDSPWLDNHRKLATAELRRPWRARMCKSIVPNLCIVDAQA